MKTFQRIVRVLALIAIAASSFASPLMAQRATSSAIPTPPPSGRIRILVNGSYNPSSTSFSESTTFTSFLEEGSSSRSYDGGKGVVFEVGAIVGIRGPLGVMGSVEVYSSNFDAQFQESLPHPLYFDQPRSVSGSETGLQYKENAVHVDAVYTKVIDKITVDVFGGPTFFFTNTEVLSAIDVASTYPFDEATVTGTTRRKIDDNPIGFNAGGSFTWKLTDVFGVAFQARYSRGTIHLENGSGSAIELDSGGFRVGGGIRLAF
jgi:hypothetical protein